MKRSFKSGVIVFTVISALCSVTKNSLAQRVRLSRQEKDLVRAKLDMIKNPVTVHIYTGGGGRGRTGEALALLELMKTTSPLVNFVEHDIDEDESLKEDLGVNHGPVMALKGEKFFGISYYGFPAQLELEPFLDGILIASGKMPPLSPSTSAFLAKMDQDVHIRVFVTPD
jgi:hypothetical protein